MNRNIIFIILLIGTIFLVFFGLGDSIYYAKSGIKHWVPFIIIAFAIPTIIYLWVRKNPKIANIPKAALGLAIGPILIIGPSFGFWQEHLSQKDLAANGAITYGIIDKKWQSRSKNNRGEWLFTCQFKVNGVTYHTYSGTDPLDVHNIGDSVKVMYSKRYPDNCKILQ